MATLMERMAQDLTAAMRAREELRTSVLRMAKTALTNKEIEKKAPLDEDEVLRVLQGMVKQREDSIDQFGKGGRQDLIDQERKEIVILQVYLPAQAGDEEIAAAVDQAMRETGCTSVKDMGKVMKGAQAALKAMGKPADGKRVSEAVRRKLGA